MDNLDNGQKDLRFAAYYHDSAVAMLINGEIIAAVMFRGIVC